jgi:hypothetical protein
VPSRLQGEIVAVEALGEGLVERMYRVYERCYDGGDPLRFRRDLSEKRWVILLRDLDRDTVAGFSTQRVADLAVGGRPVRALFSGDTIIDPGYWGEQALVQTFCVLVGRVLAASEGRLLYWFLVSKGHRTYLYLPTFFHEFFPRYDRGAPPFEAELMSRLGRDKFGADFDSLAGIVRPRGPHDRLKPQLDGSARRRQNPHVAFFLAKNPGHAEGEELLCVASLHPDNLRPIVRRSVIAAMAAEATPVG